jgi:hypothetical protein
LTYDNSAGTIGLEAAAGGGVSLANDGNNRVVTATGSGGINGEANLTYDGTTLAVTASGTSTTLLLESTDAGNADAPILELHRNSASPANGDDMGQILWSGEKADSSKYSITKMYAEINTVDNSDRLMINIASSGGSGLNNYEYMRFDGGVRDVIINEEGRDIDFRIEGDSDTSLFFTDASTDRIGIGTNSPDTKLHVSSGTVLLGSVFDKPTNSTFDAADAQLILGGAFNAEFNTGTDKVSLLISSHDNDDGTALYPIFVQDENVGNNSDALTGADFFIKNRQVSNGDSTAYFGGKVGIGNISPATKLDVSGSITVADDIIHSGDTNTKIAFGADTQSFQTGGTARFNANNSGLQIGTGARVTTILDEDNMASDSATALATQQSIKAYVDANSGGGSSSGGTVDKFVAIQNTSSGDSSPIINVNVTTPVAITWLSEVHKDSIYTHSTSSSPQTITINNGGTFILSYNINTENTGTNRFVPKTFVYVNGSAVLRTLATSYSRGSVYDSVTTATWTGVIELSPGDTVEVRMGKDDADQTSQVRVQQEGTSISLARISAVGNTASVIDVSSGTTTLTAAQSGSVVYVTSSGAVNLMASMKTGVQYVIINDTGANLTPGLNGNTHVLGTHGAMSANTARTYVAVSNGNVAAIG